MYKMTADQYHVNLNNNFPGKINILKPGMV